MHFPCLLTYVIFKMDVPHLVLSCFVSVFFLFRAVARELHPRPPAPPLGEREDSARKKRGRGKEEEEEEEEKRRKGEE